MTLWIHGSSDDLVQIDGAWAEELSCYADDGETRLGISDGTLLSVKYDGDWHFTIARVGAGTNVAYFPVGESCEEEPKSRRDYSALVRLDNESGFSWVMRSDEVRMRPAGN